MAHKTSPVKRGKYMFVLGKKPCQAASGVLWLAKG